MSERLSFLPKPETLFAYVYAVLHSPAYRRKYSEYLRQDFPRIPLPDSADRFIKLAEIGGKLIACHVLPQCRVQPLEFVGPVDLLVSRGFPRLRGNVVELNRRFGLRIADPAAWTFHVGGHPVLHRWLQVRRGRTLTPEDLQYFAWLYEVAVTTQPLAMDIDLAAPD
jgi:hypothetical protein